MNFWYQTRRRAELLLVPFRVALVMAAGAWAAATPAELHPDADVLIAVAAGATLAVATALTTRYFRSSWRIALQAVDALIVASVVVASPGDFLMATAAMLYLLLGSILRFEWNETLALGLIGSCVVALMHAFRLQHFDVLELLYVLVLCAISCGFAAFAYYLRTKRTEIALALTIPDWTRDRRSVTHQQLENAARAMRVPRVAALWRDPDGRPELLEWDGQEMRRTVPPFEDWSDMTADELEGLDFFTDDAQKATSAYTIYGRVKLPDGGAVSSAMIAMLPVRSVLVTRIESVSISGSILFLDRRFDSDDLLLGRLLAEVFASRLDALWVAAKRQLDAATEERTRIARDLHDGLLQSLGGVAMQLEAAGKMMETNPDAARSLVRAIQDILSVDQHELRSLVNTMRAGTRLRQSDLRSGTRFTALAALVRLQWGVDVDVRFDSLDGKIPKGRRREIHRLLREAVFNAAKHAKANRVIVEGGLEGDCVRIVVSDDGQGFPFRGRYDLGQLHQLNVGPATLKERIALMGGELLIDSTAAGSRLEIVVPMQEGAQS